MPTQHGSQRRDTWMSELLGTYGMFSLIGSEKDARSEVLEDKLMRAKLQENFNALIAEISNKQEFITQVTHVTNLASNNTMGATEFLFELVQRVKGCHPTEAEHRTNQMIRGNNEAAIREIFPEADITNFLMVNQNRSENS